MPLSRKELEAVVERLREQGRSCMRNVDREFEKELQWCKDAVEQICIKNYSGTTAPLTSTVPGRKNLLQHPAIDSSESQVTSTANILDNVQSSNPWTLRSRSTKDGLGVNHSGKLAKEIGVEGSCVMNAGAKGIRERPDVNESIRAEPHSTGPNQSSVTCSKESIGANSTFVKGGPYPKESIGANSTFVKEGPYPKESIGANSTCVKEGPCPKESIGANSTYVVEGPCPKESIGANSTYVKEGPCPKESIGANSTYIKAGPCPKESIGANSTYVKEGPCPKESIGANSTYVKEGPCPKESIGANSTYVVDGPCPKESMGANSTTI